MFNLSQEKELVWVQILYLFVAPVLLLYFGVISEDAGYLVLFVVSLLMIGIVKHNNWTSSDFGVKKDFWKDFYPYFLFTLGGVGFLFWLSQISSHQPMISWWQDYRFLLLFIPISFFQEIAFRGILMNMLKRAFSNPIFIIGLNAVLFSLVHIIYLNPIFTIPVTFIAGIGFAWLYYQYPNLILISISHAVLNFVAMILGFFIIN
jgi:membrane protease YdiL (CAAX protease family)